MSYIIKASDFNIHESSRLCIKNMETNKFEDLVILNENEQYNFTDKFKNAKTINYKFKFQTKDSSNNWKNSTGYYGFLNYFPVNLERYWLGKIDYNDRQLKQLIDFYFQHTGKESYKYIINAFNSLVTNIEKAPVSNLNNLKKYLSIIENIEYKIPKFWKNINLYLTHLYKFRITVVNLTLGSKTFLELQSNSDKNTEKFRIFLRDEIKTLTSYNMEFTNFLAGRYHSFFAEREKALSLFNDFLTLENEIISELHMSRGITSYFDLNDSTKERFEINEPKMIDDVNQNKFNTTVLMSVDRNFLKKYGMHLFSNIIALKEYHFHIHLIGEESEVMETMTDAKSLFEQMIKFYEPKISVARPTYSIETVPGYVKQLTTYYACSRFIHADYFMDLFKKNILIFDADYSINDGFHKLFKEIEKLDVGMSVRNTRACMSPWTRYMGGSVFLKQNGKAKEFIKHLRDYILAGLNIENSWILDQNALSYASEKMLANNSEFNISNIPYDLKPFKQTQIRYYIEEILPR